MDAWNYALEFLGVVVKNLIKKAFQGVQKFQIRILFGMFGGEDSNLLALQLVFSLPIICSWSFIVVFLFFLCCPLIIGYFASMRANFGIANLRLFGEKTTLPLWILEFWSPLFLHFFCFGRFPL